MIAKEIVNLLTKCELLLTCSLTHISTAIKAAEGIVNTVNISLANTPAVRQSASTGGGGLREGQEPWGEILISMAAFASFYCNCVTLAIITKLPAAVPQPLF